MRYSGYYIPTLKEAPQDAEALSQKLLTRAGYVRKLSPGVFTMLPVGQRVVGKLEGLLKETLNACGGFEISTSGNSGDTKAIIRQLGEDIISYKELPRIFFELKNINEDSIRPRLGMLVPKAFRSVNGFALASDSNDMESAAARLANAFYGFFGKMDLKVISTEDLSTDYCGKKDVVFIASFSSGEKTMASCGTCGHSALLDSFPCKSKQIKDYAEQDRNGRMELKKLHTPNVRTIDELCRYLNCNSDRFAKTLLYRADGKPVAALVRGDRGLSEAKLKSLLCCRELTMADEQTVRELTKAEVGFAGPVGLQVMKVVDNEVCSMSNFIVGANETDYHLANVNVGRDFVPDITGDIRSISGNDSCGICGGKLCLGNGIVLGGIYKLDKDSMKTLGVSYRNAEGRQEAAEGLHFDINLYSLLSLIIEKNSGETGIILPEIIAPFNIEVIVVNPKDELQLQKAEEIYNKLKSNGIDVLFDDRNERAGVKFKDNELLGIPVRITVGKRITEGIVEYKARSGETIEISVEEAMKKAGV
ncbi:MAG: proline--tRNA ligase [Caulobacteraceae bacterium]